jgi:hypothetical protein
VFYDAFQCQVDPTSPSGLLHWTPLAVTVCQNADGGVPAEDANAADAR